MEVPSSPVFMRKVVEALFPKHVHNGDDEGVPHEINVKLAVPGTLPMVTICTRLEASGTLCTVNDAIRIKHELESRIASDGNSRATQEQLVTTAAARRTASGNKGRCFRRAGKWNSRIHQNDGRWQTQHPPTDVRPCEPFGYAA
uniref:Uncharacterized protein n=1 Tax=Glossina brevipalpis TaxID=37001 RepID=A0A1A9X2S4_9MUSC